MSKERREAVTFLGTGLMGAPMAQNLLRAGFPVTVWNRTAARAAPLVECGAIQAGSLREAAERADIVLAMLESGSIVEEVLFGSGFAEALPKGTLVVDMSSIPPAMAREHARRLRELGVAYLDAPVSGGTVGAAGGTLAIMVGGEADDFERAQPAFTALGKVTHVGPSGSGQLAKLANQMIVGVTIAAVAEALLLAAAGGADPAKVREAITGGFADSRVLAVHGARMVERNFVAGGPARLHLKDLDAALEAASVLGLKLPLAERVRADLAMLVASGGAGLDHSALLLRLEAQNAPHRLGADPDRLPF